jgi:hypothetical protein
MEECHGNRPVSHGALRILSCDLLEGGVCGSVGKGVEERDAAIELGLHGGRARDGKGDVAQPFGDGVVVDLLCAESTGGAGEEKREPGPVKHGGPPGNATRRVVAESEEVHVIQGPIFLSAMEQWGSRFPPKGQTTLPGLGTQVIEAQRTLLEWGSTTVRVLFSAVCVCPARRAARLRVGWA